MIYEEIRHRIPDGVPRKVKKQRPIGVKHALLFFLVLMILFAIFGTLIQFAFGMVGVFITEVFFLIGSILYVKWKGHRLKDVFPIRKPKFVSLVGTFILWAGAYILMLVCDSIVLAFDPSFPENMDAEVITSADLNWFLLFIIVAIVPAICEEAMHRGVIQYGMKKKIKNPWVMAFVIGLIFGLFHMDPSKFLATAILGGVMGWIMFQTNNMVYSSMFHFIHNASQMILLFVAPLMTAGLQNVTGIAPLMAAGLQNVTGNAPLMAAGLQNVTVIAPHITLAAGSTVMDSASFMISAGILSAFPGVFTPILLYAGNYLLMKEISPRRKPFLPTDKKERTRILKILLISTAAFLIAGFLLIAAGFGLMNM